MELHSCGRLRTKQAPHERQAWKEATDRADSIHWSRDIIVREMIRRLIFTCLACFAFLNGSGDVLWWGIFDNVTEPIYEYHQKIDEEGNLVFDDKGNPIIIGNEIGRKHIGSANVEGIGIKQFVESYGTYTEFDPDMNEWYSGYNVGARIKMTYNGVSQYLVNQVPYDDGNFTYPIAEFFDEGGQNHPSSEFGTGWWATQSILPEINSELAGEVLF